jgi:hypothetical protein
MVRTVLEHAQNVWVVALFFGLAREGQPIKQSNNPNPDPTRELLTPRNLDIGRALGPLGFGGQGPNNKNIILFFCCALFVIKYFAYEPLLFI